MKYFIFILTTALIMLLSACGTIDKLSSKSGAEEVLFLNKSGDLVVVESGKARIVPPCDASNRKGFDACKIPFDLDAVKEDSNELKQNLEKSCKTKDCKVINVKSLLIIDHPGSLCRLIYDRATGRTFQICR